LKILALFSENYRLPKQSRNSSIFRITEKEAAKEPFGHRVKQQPDI